MPTSPTKLKAAASARAAPGVRQRVETAEAMALGASVADEGPEGAPKGVGAAGAADRGWEGRAAPLAPSSAVLPRGARRAPPCR